MAYAFSTEGLNDSPYSELFNMGRGMCLHVIDPFKIELGEVVEKAKMIEDLGAPFILLGSTDYVDFNHCMSEVVDKVKSAVSIPVVSHFPPLKTGGLPYVGGVDFVIAPAIFNSGSPQFLWKSLLETYREFGSTDALGKPVPVPILSAAATFGLDEKSRRYLNVDGLQQTEDVAKELADFANRFGFQILYLFSRHGKVELKLVEMIRRYLSDEIMVFIGGGVRTPADVAAYVEAGADYVVFGTAGEVGNWREVFTSLLGQNQVARVPEHA